MSGADGRTLGVDVGTVRTGLALSDPLGITCRPLEVVVERDREALIDRIIDAALVHEVVRIVVGLPVPLSGGNNAQLESVRRFTMTLAARTNLPVATWDERFTSKLAERGRTKGEPADAVAACYMLQSYLDGVRRIERRGDQDPRGASA